MRKPNIIYILADDMGYGDISCLNEESKIRTTHLDQLAAEGMKFTDAHSSSAVCTPSRYSILTGRYNWRSVLKSGVLFGYSRPLIEKGRETVASYLKAHDYVTACIGKWHLGWDWARKSDAEEDIDFTRPVSNGPCTHGFDYFFGIIGSLDMHPYVYVENDLPTSLPDRITKGEGKQFWREGPTGADFDHEQMLPLITRKAADYVRAQAAENQPFFLYFPLPAPHTPILPLPEFRGKSGTNEYGDFCLQVDDTVGKVMQAVEEAGIKENTIFIFTSDNGCSPMANFEELAQVGHKPSYHFRGHKADIYEGGHRIPLITRWPVTIKANSVCRNTVCLADLLATCADIFGEELPDNAAEDSVSNLPVWEQRDNASPIREATVHHSINGSFSIRQGNWKLEMCPGSGGWSYPKPGEECEGLPPIQLYDLSQDIGERTNVYDKYPEVVEKLQSLLTQYIKNGRSTPGTPQPNTGAKYWPQLNWLLESDMG